MKYGKIATSAFIGLWLACVPVPGGTNDQNPGPTNDGNSGDTNDGTGSEPEPQRPRPGWPAPESPCDSVDQCDTGLFCEPLGEDTLAAFLDTAAPEETPDDCGN